MSYSKFAYALLGLIIIGAILYAGLVPGAVLAFGAYLMIALYRRYTGQDKDSNAASGSSSAVKKTSAPSLSKPAAARPKKMEKIAQPGKTAPVKPASSTKLRQPPSWRNPPRK